MIPYRILAPIILALCFWGAYCIRNSVFDIWVAVCFGMLGFVMKRYRMPAAPFVLGFILGDPLELYFRQVAALGPLAAIFQRPMAVVLLSCAVLVVVLYTVFREKQEKGVAVEED
jgi:putative tricarboxylic transport membrane protein